MNYEQIIQDFTIFNGVNLDKMICVEARGGKKVYWRASSKREAWFANWHPTQRQAANYATRLNQITEEEKVQYFKKFINRK
jgi:hypothetical protein